MKHETWKHETWFLDSLHADSGLRSKSGTRSKGRRLIRLIQHKHKNSTNSTPSQRIGYCTPRTPQHDSATYNVHVAAVAIHILTFAQCYYYPPGIELTEQTMSFGVLASISSSRRYVKQYYGYVPCFEHLFIYL